MNASSADAESSDGAAPPEGEAGSPLEGRRGRISFYTRQDCHLCSAAFSQVEYCCAQVGIDASEWIDQYDVDNAEALRTRYDQRVPVCYVGEKHAFDFKCDEAAFTELLHEFASANEIKLGGEEQPVSAANAALKSDRSPSQRTELIVDARVLRKPLSGVGRYTLSMLKALERQADRVALHLLVNGESWREIAEWSSETTVTPIAAELESHPMGDLRYHGLLPRWLAKSFPAEAIFWGPAFQVPWFGLKQRSIVTIHDLAAFLYPQTMPTKFAYYLRWLVRGSIKRADAIVSVSDATKRDLVERLKVSPEKVSVIKEAALMSGEGDDEAAPSDEIPDVLKEVGGRFFLFVGALEPRKNITFLLDVFRKHVASHPNDRLVLCGPPGWNNAEILQAIESFQPADRLVRLSYVSDAELRWLYRNASCLLMPSLYEGFGLPPLEAAALGTPSLVSDGGSLPEVVATPEQVIPLDVEKWVKALTSLPAISSEQLKAFAAGFSWDCAATELLDLIETKLI